MREESFNSQKEKVWIFAGESSGDLYGSHLAKAINNISPDASISGMGGREMRAAGVDIMVDSTELDVMGIIEVLKHYPKFKRIFDNLVERAAKERPSVVVLIDYPGFNLRFAAKMKELDIKVVYYISPQIWAWKKGRAPKIAATVDHMMVIFPFEKDLYKEYNLPTTFIGHPLVDILAEEKKEQREDDLLLLLPGSRATEVKRIFPTMLQCAMEIKKNHPEMKFCVPAPRETIGDLLHEIANEAGIGEDKLKFDVICGRDHELMQRATAGIAASGTVTVQCAMLGLPLVSVYRMNALTHWIVKKMAKVDFFTMVNIIAQKVIFEEYAQADFSVEKVVPALERILPGGERRKEVLDGIDFAISRLGTAMPASRNAAEIVLKTASSSQVSQ